MAAGTRRSKLQVDADGVRIERLGGVRGGVWLAAAVLLFGAVALLFFTRRAPAPPPGRTVAAAPPVTGGQPRERGRSLPPAAVEPRRAPAVPAAVDPPSAEATAAPPDDAADAPEHQDPVFTEAKDGEPSGLALFPPLGSDPLKRGLVVPDDFELPPGFVRHHQTTDDGEELPPILMFHPDYHPVDASGEPLELPANRVVPADMAPAGMPLEMLQLPDQEDGAPAAAP